MAEADGHDRNGTPTAGRFLVLSATVLWSTSGLFAKAPWFLDWPESDRGMLLAFWRALFATLAMLPFLGRGTWTWRLVPMAATFVMMNVTYLSAMVHTTAANAIWLQYTAPLWVFLVGVGWLGEPFRRRDVVRMALCLAGVGFILVMEAGGEQASGVWLGLAAGGFYAGTILGLRSLRDLDTGFLMAVNHAATALVLAPVAFTRGSWPHGPQWPALALFGVVQMALPYWLFARGVRHLVGHEASALALLEPVLV
ncbi:MAG TPA: EamA/RhaT family transporter, partial [Bryobacterales bacterium]|nr:EamA/RhaT family transporter [Bryobacterales bacterium]